MYRPRKKWILGGTFLGPGGYLTTVNTDFASSSLFLHLLLSPISEKPRKLIFLWALIF